LQRWKVALGTPTLFGPFRLPLGTFTVSTPMVLRTSSRRQAGPSHLVCQFALNRRHLEYFVTSERDNGVEEITSQQYQDMLNGLSDVPALTSGGLAWKLATVLEFFSTEEEWGLVAVFAAVRSS
jgi:hypothetical protein